jgi:hypothetical protein
MGGINTSGAVILLKENVLLTTCNFIPEGCQSFFLSQLLFLVVALVGKAESLLQP